MGAESGTACFHIGPNTLSYVWSLLDLINNFLGHRKTLKSDTFAVCAAEGDGGRVPVNDVQEEVRRVVVGLTGVSWEMNSKSNYTHQLCSQLSLVGLKKTHDFTNV